MGYSSTKPKVLLYDASGVPIITTAGLLHVTLRGEDNTELDWGGSNTGNPLGIYILGSKSGGGFNIVPAELNPFTGEIGVNVNVMPYGDPIPVEGNKSSNGAVPGATNVGVLAGIAQAAAPSHTEGRLVGLRTNLAGDLAISLDGEPIPAGTNNIGDVDVLTLPGVTGSTAHDSPGSSVNPVAVGGYASNAVPSDVSADTDIVRAWLLRNGAFMTAKAPHLGMVGDPYTLTFKCAQYTTAQTGTALWTPAGGKKVVITSYQIQAAATTAATLQLWFESSNGDTTYTRGTDAPIFDGEFAPSATLKPGAVQTGLWIAQGADFDLRVTTSANLTVTITVWGYEI